MIYAKRRIEHYYEPVDISAWVTRAVEYDEYRQPKTEIWFVRLPSYAVAHTNYGMNWQWCQRVWVFSLSGRGFSRIDFTPVPSDASDRAV